MINLTSCMRGSRGWGGGGGQGGGAGGPDRPEKLQKDRFFFSNNGRDPLKKKSAFNVGPSSARQQNAF